MDFLGTALSSLKTRLDDDFTDRLNYYYTSTIILLFAIIVSAQQWVGQPIECWVPAQFTGAWEEYSENFCFVQNTYFLPISSQIPQEIEFRDEKQLGYYQWVPFILALQAMCFYGPNAIWYLLSWGGGSDISSVITMANGSGGIPEDDGRNKYYTPGAHSCPKCFECVDICALSSHRGSYISFVHLFVKLLFAINAIGQMFLMSLILGTKDRLWGLTMFLDIIKGEPWEITTNFPRVTFCDFEVRALGNVHRHTIQCVLMINMFNEKIFAFLWCWFAFVFFLTILSLIRWFLRMCSVTMRVHFVEKYVNAYYPLSDNEDSRQFLKRFVLFYLRQDGILFLHKLAQASGEIVTSKVTYHLFVDFRDFVTKYMTLKPLTDKFHINSSVDDLPLPPPPPTAPPSYAAFAMMEDETINDEPLPPPPAHLLDRDDSRDSAITQRYGTPTPDREDAPSGIGTETPPGSAPESGAGSKRGSVILPISMMVRPTVGLSSALGYSGPSKVARPDNKPKVKVTQFGQMGLRGPGSAQKLKTMTGNAGKSRFTKGVQ